jgi:hypothetical protein
MLFNIRQHSLVSPPRCHLFGDALASSQLSVHERGRPLVIRSVTELDVKLTWNATSYLAFIGGYSHFFAGDYLKATGAHDDADFGYVQATLKF